ncbi:hypothetical protein [Humibacter sp. RRB41]|uniref:hypothetical protein n=1 Tax=Humibacter sp. RRB41 TaxID=2919946 RepID=UPI001FAA32A3|nr:hypothetical protein [Humibacter sp. RRB41]
MSPEEQVERAVQRCLGRAEYRFDVAIAELRGEPRPESPEERAARELRESWAAVGRYFGEAAKVLASLVNAFGNAFAAAVTRD